MFLFRPTQYLRKFVPFGLMIGCVFGCGTGKSLTHDNDPLLGSFNRPITRTPPPTGPNVGNVWQGGPGMYSAPAISNNIEPYIPGQPLPLPGTSTPIGGATSTYLLPGAEATNAALAGGDRSSKGTIRHFMDPTDMESAPTTPQRVGPGIPLDNRFQGLSNDHHPSTAAPNPNGIRTRSPQSMTTSSGSAIVPNSRADYLPEQINTPSDIDSIKTMEEGQQVLSQLGVRWQRLERVEGGDWQFSCSIITDPNATHAKRYSARHLDQFQAMKAVLEQVVRDR